LNFEFEMINRFSDMGNNYEILNYLQKTEFWDELKSINEILCDLLLSYQYLLALRIPLSYLTY